MRHRSVRIGAPVIRSSPDKIVLAFAGRALIAARVGCRADVRVWYLDGAQTTKGNRVRVFEGVKLRKARAPKGFPGQPVRRQWNSANDRIWVLAGAKFATVFPGRHSVLTVADRVPLPGGCLACPPAGPAVIGHRRCAAQLLPSDTDMT